MTRRIVPLFSAIALTLGCAPDPDPSPEPDPDPTPVESSSGASEPASAEEPTGLSHQEALTLLRAEQVLVNDIEGQDCVPPEEPITVEDLVEDAAANAVEQSTECAPDGTGQSCTSQFMNNSGDEMEEFFIKLEYRVEGGAIVEWRGCVFAG